MSGMRHGGAALVLLALLATMPLPAPAAKSEGASTYYEDALIRFDRNDLDGAEIQIKNALQQNRDHLASHILLGRIYLLKGRAEAAVFELQTANRLGADRTTTDPYRARAYLQLGRYKDLIDTVSGDGLAPRTRAEVLAARGSALLELGQLFDAEQAFASAKDADPASPAGWSGMTVLRLRQGALVQAEQEAQHAVDLGPGDAEAWNALASVMHQSGKDDEALAAYARALEVDPRMLAARLARAGLLLDLDRLDEAGQDIESLRKEYPVEPRGMLLRALWLQRRGETDAARAALADTGAVLKAVPRETMERFPALLLVSGMTHSALGELERARDDLARYLELAPDNPGARKQLGAVYVRLNEPTQAVAVLEPARLRVPDDPRILALLGIAYSMKGSHLVATELLEKASALSGGAADIRTDLAASQLRIGRQEQALDELATVYDKDPAQTRAGVLLAGLHLQRGEAAKAVDILQQLVGQEPRNLTFLNLLASALLASGRQPEARTMLERAIEIDPAFLPAQLGLARLDILARKFDQARARLQARLQATPENVQLLVEMARVDAITGARDTAIQRLERARSLSADAIEPRQFLIDLYLRRNEGNQALEVAEELVARHPDNLASLAALGTTQLVLGKGPLAQVTFRRMVKFAGFDPIALMRIARLQEQAGALNDSAFTLEQAVHAEPNRPELLAALAGAYLVTGRLEEAEEQARRLQQLDPASPVSQRLLAEALLRRNKPAEAAAMFRQAMAKTPSAELVIGAFRALLADDRAADGIRMLEDWVAQHPDDRNVRTALAEGYMRAERWKEALPLYEALLAVQPEQPQVLNNLAYIALQTGDEAKALDYARRAAALAPQDPAITDTLGWILVRAGRAQEALQYLREAQSRDAGNPEIRYHLGVALMQLGRKAEARRQFEQAIAVKLAYPGIEEARRLYRETAGP
ncbi:MAG TPA: PEP-CTERM system TPR-repeat protein PrsT [Plasticicumulans sp.]|uniref:XrtA/PEP-CTERM system TPR-repeat protein PrsT n=1 Tax=Plasticicumulans sp. TaxID=2307179 RepID=UPI002B836019|nr:XrtA/PEP-CTERM system TPR-repeat protein PrsT [Plasticicumulans sp.]HMV37878.1 PEP-CTERM system TPR-repeat protein PrsT [Plasticicumulans sp.]HMW28771.1 PEP-CTERM system TPR-repeat protein PrsT [Plasticicumulans sp.]HMW41258.1 PEP-CTERM system TPR-repeat protein PrsT [Plasticicumulans sp.]